MKIIGFIILSVLPLMLNFSQENSKKIQTNSEYEFNSYENTTSKTVFGFLPSWIYGLNPNVAISYDLLTHLAVFSYEADIDGNLTPPQDSLWPWYDVFDKAIDNNVKLIMTVSNFNSDEIHSLLTDNGKRKNLFKNIANTIIQVGYSGMIIDFENVNAGNDRQYAFKNFIRLLKQELNVFPSFELSVALPANGSGDWDFTGIAEYCDFVFIMGYDYYGSWSSTTGPSAPLTGTTFYLKKDIDEYYKDVAPQKIILGVPYYGNIWDVNSGEPYADANSFNGVNQTNNWQASLFYKDIVSNYSSYEKLFDDVSSTSWMRYKESDSTWKQIWYDDTTSLALKYDWVLQKDFKGIGIWALGYDDGRTELWDLIYNKFFKPTSVTIDEPINYGYELKQNYPNPFNPSTIIKYNMPAAGYVSLKIYDMLGREIYNLVNGYKTAGEYSVEFRVKSKEFSSGVYFCTLQTGGYTSTKKMIFLK
ncbi:MAG: glycosyl hydrolase family 18 protein [Mobilitalea sp.]